jgi:hypothetical protein
MDNNDNMDNNVVEVLSIGWIVGDNGLVLYNCITLVEFEHDIIVLW